MLDEFTVSGRVVQGLLETAETAGVSRSHLLRAAKIEPAQLAREDARVMGSDVYRLCELALDLTNDPALGLHWAEGASGETFNPLSHMIAHSPSLRHAFESLAQCSGVLSDDPSFELIENDGTVAVRITPPVGASLRSRRFTAEMLLGSFVRLLRSFSPRAQPLQVNFDFAAPAQRDDYTRVFRGLERFDQPHSELVFDRSLMELASPYKDEDVHRALRTIAERRLLQLSERVPYSLRARDYLVQRSPSARAEMPTVARALGLSERSLRRRLEAEGKTFYDVVNEAQCIVAKSLLQSTRQTIQEIAYTLGFSDASAFHRAFKRWTNTTPLAYRERAG